MLGTVIFVGAIVVVGIIFVAIVLRNRAIIPNKERFYAELRGKIDEDGFRQFITQVVSRDLPRLGIRGSLELSSLRYNDLLDLRQAIIRHMEYEIHAGFPVNRDRLKDHIFQAVPATESTIVPLVIADMQKAELDLLCNYCEKIANDRHNLSLPGEPF